MLPSTLSNRPADFTLPWCYVIGRKYFNDQNKENRPITEAIRWFDFLVNSDTSSELLIQRDKYHLTCHNFIVINGMSYDLILLTPL
jgi:hypothetical protein